MSNGNYQETHERILKSGLAAFLEEGFEKANLRRICKAAGVTTGAGEYAPMPPVFGPRSPSSCRL